MAWRASGNLSRRPYFLSCGLPLNCLNEEVGGMARQGWSMSEMEIRRIAYLLSETDLVVAAIAERMDCSKSAMMTLILRSHRPIEAHCGQGKTAGPELKLPVVLRTWVMYLTHTSILHNM